MAIYIDLNGNKIIGHRINSDKEMPFKKQFSLTGEKKPSIPIANLGDWRINREGKISYVNNADFHIKYHRPFK